MLLFFFFNVQSDGNMLLNKTVRVRTKFSDHVLEYGKIHEIEPRLH